MPASAAILGSADHGPLDVIVDTREHHPFRFAEAYATPHATALRTFDYGLLEDCDFEGKVHPWTLERKGLADWITSIVGGWENEYKKIMRAKEENTGPIVYIVEGRFEDMLTWPGYARLDYGPAVAFRQWSIMVYRLGVHVIFAGQLGAEACLLLLKRRAEHIGVQGRKEKK
jgi:ERCC4-type nuclease